MRERLGPNFSENNVGQKTWLNMEAEFTTSTPTSLSGLKGFNYIYVVPAFQIGAKGMEF